MRMSGPGAISLIGTHQFQTFCATRMARRARAGKFTFTRAVLFPMTSSPCKELSLASSFKQKSKRMSMATRSIKGSSLNSRREWEGGSRRGKKSSASPGAAHTSALLRLCGTRRLGGLLLLAKFLQNFASSNKKICRRQKIGGRAASVSIGGCPFFRRARRSGGASAAAKPPNIGRSNFCFQIRPAQYRTRSGTGFALRSIYKSFAPVARPSAKLLQGR